MKRYIVALDQGTTSCRAIVFDRQQNIVASAQKEFRQIYPNSGWVEHDPIEIYSCQYGVMMEAITRGGIAPSEIAAIGITNQRETTVVWEKATGKPIANAIVWQCRRTAELCDALRARGLAPYIRETTGLVLDAYFSATKIRWLLDHVPDAQARAERGELLFRKVGPENQRCYKEGDTLPLGGLTLRVLETPGHSEGSVCLLVEGQHVLFAGDTLFRCSCGRCDFPGGDYRKMLASLARLASLEGDYRVLPGHDRETTMDYERRVNPYMRQGTAR